MRMGPNHLSWRTWGGRAGANQVIGGNNINRRTGDVSFTRFRTRLPGVKETILIGRTLKQRCQNVQGCEIRPALSILYLNAHR